jgi:hypothetical protein
VLQCAVWVRLVVNRFFRERQRLVDNVAGTIVAEPLDFVVDLVPAIEAVFDKQGLFRTKAARASRRSYRTLCERFPCRGAEPARAQLAVELLERLLEGEIKSRFARNVCRRKFFPVCWPT